MIALRAPWRISVTYSTAPWYSTGAGAQAHYDLGRLYPRAPVCPCGYRLFSVEVLTLRGLATYYVLFFTATRSRMFYYWTPKRMWRIQSWCGVTCSRTEGALLATAGFQALGKSTPMSGTSVCALGNDRYGQRK